MVLFIVERNVQSVLRIVRIFRRVSHRYFDYTRVVPKLVLILSGWTCNAIYRNSYEAHVFCSALPFQQAPVDIYTWILLLSSLETYYFRSTFGHRPPCWIQGFQSDLPWWQAITGRRLCKSFPSPYATCMAHEASDVLVSYRNGWLSYSCL